MRLLLFAAIATLLPTSPALAENGYAVAKVDEGVYAAIAKPGSQATSNAFFVEGDEYVVAAGAHLTKQAIQDLSAAAASVTAKPIRYFILPHHHRGYSHIDFDFPPGKDVIMSWPTWQALAGEVREIGFPVLFFGEGLTLKLGARTVILTTTGGHTDGDVLLYIPETGTLFASDLLYVRSVGYMGDARMQQWLLALELMESLGAKQIVPGYGPVSGGRDLAEFKVYLKDFLTAVLGHVEQGDSLEKTLRTFSLPRYREYDGYERFLKTNIERAYLELRLT
jgi:glyoxylase-like metal-dependent hydrolase (beta-lactamase superfamily II)